MGKIKGVEFIDSQKLLDAANTIDACLKDYKNIIKRISTTTNDLLDS